MDAFAKQSLDAHNSVRALHNVPPLKWSAELATACQAWAEKIAEQTGLQHGDNLKSIGENIFMTSNGYNSVGIEATKNWYSEITKYNFSRGRYQRGTGHFTQVVWKSSEELGMARARSANGSIYVVARYSPGGNDLNKFNGNVLPPIGHASLELFNGMNGEAEEEDEEEEMEEEDEEEMEEEDEEEMEEEEKGEVKEGEVKTVFLTDSVKAELVASHNEYRSLHGVPAVTWSDKIANEAEQFAMELARNGEMYHASKDKRELHGESICRLSDHYQLADAVSFWYAEINKYDFFAPGFSMEHGHFTQLVWGKTRKVGIGCARSQGQDGLTYLVARYWPPGNVLKEFEDNVLPPLGC